MDPAPAVCAAVWQDLSGALSVVGLTTGTLAASGGGARVIENLLIDGPDTYSPDVLADRVTLRGATLAWWQDGTKPPDPLEIGIKGLRVVVKTGNPQMDHLMAAQARVGVSAATAALV